MKQYIIISLTILAFFNLEADAETRFRSVWDEIFVVKGARRACEFALRALSLKTSSSSQYAIGFETKTIANEVIGSDSRLSYTVSLNLDPFQVFPVLYVIASRTLVPIHKDVEPWLRAMNPDRILMLTIELDWPNQLPSESESKREKTHPPNLMANWNPSLDVLSRNPKIIDANVWTEIFNSIRHLVERLPGGEMQISNLPPPFLGLIQKGIQRGVKKLAAELEKRVKNRAELIWTRSEFLVDRFEKRPNLVQARRKFYELALSDKTFLSGLKQGKVFEKHSTGPHNSLLVDEDWISSELQQEVRALDGIAMHPSGLGFGTYCLRMLLNDVFSSRSIQEEFSSNSKDPIYQVFGDSLFEPRIKLGVSSTNSKALELHPSLVLQSK